MKKLTSLILVIVMLITAFAAAPFRAAAENGFEAGDELFLKISSPADWATSPAGVVLYANFTDATRAENDNSSVVIASADHDRYDPVTGVTYDRERGLYKYTVTDADAGKTVMRFWRGNTEKLWNESVEITADDVAAGKDTAVVTDWSNTGYLTSSSGQTDPTEPSDDPTEPPVIDAPVTAFERSCVYAHAASGSDDKEAWIKGQWIDNNLYFFMPSSAKKFDSVELYNTYSDSVIIDGTAIPSCKTALFRAQADQTYRASIEPLDLAVNVRFMFSSAEAALWVNNTERYDGYSDFFSYLQDDKENSVAASGAIATPDGKIENTPIKKMKGRGNTSWNADKKGFNVTLDSAVKLAGMDKCKKFSLISNFQDAAMARNRILYDLSDAVGIPYASDSRFIDLYTNGEYQGTYQMCRKIDVSKNGLITEFAEDDYLDTETGGVKEDFGFVTEIDSSPGADDFTVSARNGNNLTMKAPELSIDSPYYYAVSDYISNKYNTMYDNLGKANVNDYIDVTSLAKVYLINELGKNWDSGATSFYFTYKQDADGAYKFYASPVWDYDNSLGNARGIDRDLRNMGVSDYTLPSGWFSTKKNGYNGPNFLAEAVKNPVVMTEVRRTWFEDFVPALDVLNSDNGSQGELHAASYYADILRDTAAMNYKVWNLITDSGWIADHSSLRQYKATYTKNGYGQITGVNLTQNSTATRYDQYSFDGQFDYMMDWTNSRAAWISSQYIADYTPTAPTEPPTQAPTDPPTQPATEPEDDYLLGDADSSKDVNIIDVTVIQRALVSIGSLNETQKKAADVDKDGIVTIIDATIIQRALAGIYTPYLSL